MIFLQLILVDRCFPMHQMSIDYYTLWTPFHSLEGALLYLYSHRICNMNNGKKKIAITSNSIPTCYSSKIAPYPFYDTLNFAGVSLGRCIAASTYCVLHLFYKLFWECCFKIRYGTTVPPVCIHIFSEAQNLETMLGTKCTTNSHTAPSSKNSPPIHRGSQVHT